MNRGRRREEIFTSPQDYQLFVEVLKEAAEIFHLQVAAYCLMPNHYHLLIHTPDGNVSRCMRHVNGIYTQRFNRRYKIDGQLFRGRFKALLVDADSYLLELLRYIHRNPLLAGLAENLDAYEYSSHKAYISDNAKWDWLHKDFVLSMFSAKKRQAVKAYKEFVAQGEPQEIVDFFSLKNMPSIIGTKEFKEWIRERFHDLRLNREISG
jgi:REP element-mobilizing transposase RayT